jgi:hypothetical protein
VPDLTDAQLKALKELPEKDKRAPEVLSQGEYWPTGHGKTQLERFLAPAGKRGFSQQKRSPTASGQQEDSQQKRSPSTVGFVKRAEQSDGSSICSFGEDCYTYPYPIEDMYEWYKDATW